jgi:hypothetical protein
MKRFKVSRAEAIALAALFFSLTGVGIAATGSPFILGQSNTADQPTALTNTGSGPAASFTSAKSSPSIEVSSKKVVKKLNADMLDGLDSADLQHRVTEDCTFLNGLGAVQGINADGGVNCTTFPQFIGTQTALPPNDYVMYAGGNGNPQYIVVYANGSGYRTDHAGVIGMEVDLCPGSNPGCDSEDAVDSFQVTGYTNEIGSHKTFVGQFNLLVAPDGNFTIAAHELAGTVFDSNDTFTWTAIQIH